MGHRLFGLAPRRDCRVSPPQKLASESAHGHSLRWYDHRVLRAHSPRSDMGTRLCGSPSTHSVGKRSARVRAKIRPAQSFSAQKPRGYRGTLPSGARTFLPSSSRSAKPQGATIQLLIGQRLNYQRTMRPRHPMAAQHVQRSYPRCCRAAWEARRSANWFFSRGMCWMVNCRNRCDRCRAKSWSSRSC